MWLLSENYAVASSLDPNGKEVWTNRRLGDDALITATIDAGKLKLTEVFYVSDRLLSISCTDGSEVWAVGERSAVFHYQNGWTRSATEVDKKYTFLRAIAKGSNVWLVGGDWTETPSVIAGHPRPGVLLRSYDNGGAWRDETPQSASVLSDLFVTDDGIWLVGAQGSIFLLRDKENSWTRMPSPTQKNLSGIFSLDAQNGWIVGDQSTVLRLSKD